MQHAWLQWDRAASPPPPPITTTTRVPIHGTPRGMAALQGPIIRPVGELAHHSAPIVSLGSAYQSRRGAWADDLGCELVSADESGRLAVWEARSPGTHRWAGAWGRA